MNDRATEARAMIQRLLKELESILDKARYDGDFATASERLSRWKERTALALERFVHPREGERLREAVKRSFLMGEPLQNLSDEIKMCRGVLHALDEELETHPENVFTALPATNAPIEVASSPAPGDSRAIFIIHGHDELNVLRLKELLKETWGLDAIVLSHVPGKGRTLIEKFEQEAQPAVFAFALLTPDDLVQVDGGEYAQARPNVVFELGWFYRGLTRSRVCILLQEGTKIHSDLNGISRIEFKGSVKEKVSEIEKELVAAGVLKNSP